MAESGIICKLPLVCKPNTSCSAIGSAREPLLRSDTNDTLQTASGMLPVSPPRPAARWVAMEKGLSPKPGTAPACTSGEHVPRPDACYLATLHSDLPAH